MYNLFIDDQIDDINPDTGVAIRDPKLIDPSREYVAKKTIEEAIDYILSHGCPIFISFDYDLGPDKKGAFRESLELAKWLIEKDLDNPGFIPENFSYQVHSANVRAKINLGILDNYLRTRN